MKFKKIFLLICGFGLCGVHLFASDFFDQKKLQPLTIRPLQQDEIERVQYLILQTPEIPTFAFDHPSSKSELQRCQKLLSSPEFNGDPSMFSRNSRIAQHLVFTIYDGTKFIGVIGLTRIPPVVANRIFRKAPAMRGLEIWLTLQAPSRQQDSGRQIVREIIRFAFERLKASNLLWRYNPTSQSTHWLAKGLNFQPLNSEFFSSRYVRYLYLANPNVTFSQF